MFISYRNCHVASWGYTWITPRFPSVHNFGKLLKILFTKHKNYIQSEEIFNCSVISGPIGLCSANLTVDQKALKGKLVKKIVCLDIKGGHKLVGQYIWDWIICKNLIVRYQFNNRLVFNVYPKFVRYTSCLGTGIPVLISCRHVIPWSPLSSAFHP